MPGAERRATIVQAAISEFARVGYSGATISRIAKSAGCSEPTMYKHFTNKRDLLVACLRTTEERVEAAILSTEDAPDRLGAWTQYADESPDYRHMLMMRMLCSTFADDEELRALLRIASDRVLERFRTGFEVAKTTGRLPADADPEYASWLWIGMSLAAFEALAISGEAGFRAASATRTHALLEAAAPIDI